MASVYVTDVVENGLEAVGAASVSVCVCVSVSCVCVCVEAVEAASVSV